MEEEIEIPKKSLREQLDELSKRVDTLSPTNKPKKKFPIPIMGLIFSLIGGGLFFTLTWLLAKSFEWGIGIGIGVLVIGLFISKLFTIEGEWKLPFKARFLGRKKKRQGYVVFMNIGMNKAVTFVKAPIIEGVASIDGIPHVISPEDVLLWKNKIPIIIQPQFSEKPYSIKSHYEQVRKDNEGTEGWTFILNYLLKSQITEKKKISWAPIVIGGLVLIGLGYYAVKSGVFN